MAETPKQPIELEDLLKLKRHECPDNDFWQQFDQEFQRRRLRALIVEESAPQKSLAARWLRGLLTGGAGFTTAAAAIWLVALQSGSIQLSSTADPATPTIHLTDNQLDFTTRAPQTASFQNKPERLNQDTASFQMNNFPEFVIDALTTESQPAGYERVHANPVFTDLLQGSAQFVSDSYGQTDRFVPSFPIERAILRF